MYSFFSNFNDTTWAEEVFDISTFFASRAILQDTAENTYDASARTINTSSGSLIPKPAKTLAGTIKIQALIFLQLTALVLLVAYIYSVPT